LLEGKVHHAQKEISNPQLSIISLGYTAKELRRMTNYDFVAHSREDIDSAVERVVQERRGFFGERKYRRKDEMVLDVEVSGTVIPYRGKEVVCGVARNLSERKRAEEALRRSESSLATAQRIAHLGNWDYDVTKDEARWSDEMYRIFGFAPQQFVPRYRTFLNFVHPDDRDLIRRSVRQTLYEEKHGSVDYRVVRPDGDIRVVQSYYEVVRVMSNRAVKLAGTVHDITERKRVEEQLKESEERYRTVVEEQTELVCRFLPDLTLTFVNDAYCRYFGLEPGEAIGESFIERVPVEDRVHYEELSAWLNEENRSRTVEHRVLRSGGEVRWQQWTDTAVFDGEGRIVEYQSVGRDITERRTLEDRLEYQALHDSLTGLPNR